MAAPQKKTSTNSPRKSNRYPNPYIPAPPKSAPASANPQTDSNPAASARFHIPHPYPSHATSAGTSPPADTHDQYDPTPPPTQRLAASSAPESNSDTASKHPAPP